MKFTVYTDPGHGWLKIHRDLAIKHGFYNDISGFSYQRGDAIYLEEDCDADLLFQALRKAEIEFKLIEKHTDRQSKIRSYKRFSRGF